VKFFVDPALSAEIPGAYCGKAANRISGESCSTWDVKFVRLDDHHGTGHLIEGSLSGVSDVDRRDDFRSKSSHWLPLRTHASEQG
jgi:hypothetical protein